MRFASRSLDLTRKPAAPQRFQIWKTGGTVLFLCCFLGTLFLLIDATVWRHRKVDVAVEGNPMYAVGASAGAEPAGAGELDERKRRKRERKLGLSIRRGVWFMILFTHIGVFLGLPLIAAVRVASPRARAAVGRAERATRRFARPSR